MTEEQIKYLKPIGRRIAKLRRANGKTQLDICAIINMEKSNLSAIENGRQNVTAWNMKRIADAIGVEVVEFYMG